MNWGYFRDAAKHRQNSNQQERMLLMQGICAKLKEHCEHLNNECCDISMEAEHNRGEALLF